MSSITSILRVKTVDESLNRSLNSSSSVSNYDTESPKDSAVKFDKIIIRIYNRTIAYNPSCSSGAPVGLSWEYSPEDIELPLEKYELHRDRCRRNKKEMLIPEEVRYDLLRYEFDVPTAEIANVTRNNMVLQRQRIKSSSQWQRREKVEAFLKSAKRGFTQMACKHNRGHPQCFTDDVILN
jgi:hypothetical protein